MKTSELGAVVSLWRYPISSLSGERRTSVRLELSGVVGDRSHGLVDVETGQVINPAQKRWQFAPQIHARLGVAAEPEVSFDGENWGLADAPPNRAKLEHAFGRPVGLRPYGEQLNELQTTHRYKLSPVHLISGQALAIMRKLLPCSQIDERRFRPNIVADLPGGLDGKPPEYDLIGREFRIGTVRLRGVQKAGRCSFTTLKQAGLDEDRAVLETLATEFDRDFGIYCEILDAGQISIGDRLTVEQQTARPEKIVIIGAGQAAGTAARTLRENGHQGDITILGDENHAPYERPGLSKSFALDQPNRSALSYVLSAQDADHLGVKLHLGETVTCLDRVAQEVETKNGHRHPYDRLILATGGSAKGLPGLNKGHGRVMLLRSIEDAQRLQEGLSRARSVFVLGGGWLGLEVAAAARQQGLEVKLFARQERVCSRSLPPVVAKVVEGWHARHGVRLELDCEPVFTEHPDYVAATVKGWSGKADLLIVAIGIMANDHLARQAGLTCDDGVVTDEDGATADPCIFAVGDVSRQRLKSGERGLRIESWQNANDQAVRAARAILGLENSPLPLPRFWSDQFGHTLHIAGLPDPKAELKRAASGGDFWEFEGFAVGIDQPLLVHQYASAQRKVESEAEPKVWDENVPEGAVRHSLGVFPAVAEGELRKVRSELYGDLVVTRIGRHMFAVAERCPHADASLAEGLIEGHRIVCPLHFAEFDLRDGSPHKAPKGCARARTYRVTEGDGQVWIWAPAEGESGTSGRRSSDFAKN